MKKIIAILIITLITLLVISVYNNYVERKIDNEIPISDTTNILTEKPYHDLSHNEIALVAQLYVKEYVKRYFKAPSTAKFPSLLKSSVETTMDGYTVVSSYVDAQNGFGAMIRSNYVVKLKQTGNGDMQLININVSQ